MPIDDPHSFAPAPVAPATGSPVRFAGQVAAFLAIQVTILVAIMWGYRPTTTSYAALLVDKHQRLEAAPDPRLILIGDSNLAFGIVSPMIKEQLGFEPVNMGLNGGLSIHFVLNEVRSSIREGDVILFSSTPGIDLKPIAPTVVFQVLETYPRGFLYESWRSYPLLLDCSHYYLAGMIRRQLSDRLLKTPVERSPIYDRSGANMYGDMTVHYNQPAVSTSTTLLLSPKVYNEDWARRIVPALNEFNAYCRARGAHLYLVDTPIEANQFALNGPVLRQRQKALKEEATARLITRQEDFIFPPDWMFDTSYHCLYDAAALRTQRVIDCLVIALQEDGVTPPRLPPADRPALPEPPPRTDATPAPAPGPDTE